MNSKWLSVFNENYNIYLRQQDLLIKKCINILEKNDNELEVDKAKRNLEQMFWRSNSARKFYWTASFHWWMITVWKIYNMLDLTREQIDNHHSYQYTICKNNYKDHKTEFEKRDKSILNILKSVWSKYFIEYDELKEKPEYFENMIKQNYSE